jgi:hypothetical protein
LMCGVLNYSSAACWSKMALGIECPSTATCLILNVVYTQSS